MKNQQDKCIKDVTLLTSKKDDSVDTQENKAGESPALGFNLFDSRTKWCSKWIKKGRLSGRAMAELKQIDNELKEKLKRRINYISNNNQEINNEIEKTFGGTE